MEQGDLGTVEIGGHSFPNPLGLSIEVNDVELIIALLEDPKFLALGLTTPLDVHISVDAEPLTEQGKVIFDLVTEIGQRIALQHARKILQLAGLDIADRPISVEPALVLGESTKFHILTPIIILADQEKK